MRSLWIKNKYINKKTKTLNQVNYSGPDLATDEAYQHYIFKDRVKLICSKIDYLFFLGKVERFESIKLKMMANDFSSVDTAEGIVDGLMPKKDK